MLGSTASAFASIALLTFALAPLATGQVPTIDTVAGTGAHGHGGDGGPAISASFEHLYDLGFDGVGNAYVAEYGAWPQGLRVRKIDVVTGIITTVLGGGSIAPPSDGLPGTELLLSNWTSIAVDPAGDVYFSDLSPIQGRGLVIRRYDAVTGLVSTIAGGGVPGIRQLVDRCGNVHNWAFEPSGDGGPAIDAYIMYISALALDPEGNIYCGGLYSVRRIDRATGIITRVAGNGEYRLTSGTTTNCIYHFFHGIYSGDGGPALEAGFGGVQDIALDGQGNLFIADYEQDDSYQETPAHSRIRRIDAQSGIITTIAGTGVGYGGDGVHSESAVLGRYLRLTADASGNLYVTDSDNSRVRRIDAATGIIETIAGNGSFGYGGDDGPASEAILNEPWGLAFDPLHALWILEYGGFRIRRITGLNQPPVADAGPDFVGVVGAVVELDGSASHDPESAPLMFAWQLAEVPGGSAAVLADPTSVTPSFLPDVEGIYTLWLTVDDGRDSSAVDEVRVSVLTPVEFAEEVAALAALTVAELPQGSVSSIGNQNTMVVLLSGASSNFDAGNVAAGRQKLLLLLSRTDGCVLRGSPDTTGGGRDWITDCEAQEVLYYDLLAALEALEQ